MKIFAIFLIIATFSITACSETSTPNYDSDYIALQNAGIYDAVNMIDNFKYSAPEIKSHITQTELIADFPDGRQIIKELPDSVMYIAAAPYINTTHICEIHYPSSCEGELSEKTFRITIKDSLGNEFSKKEITSLKNGFFELWLPRDKYFKFHIEYNSLKSDGIITTYPDSKTCITTISLIP